MIAAIQNPFGKTCIIRWTGRVGLQARARTYCGQELNAGDGVLQIPDNKATCETCVDKVKAEEIRR